MGKVAMANFSSPINLVVAHGLEAKPIIEQFGLDLVSDGGAFRRYQGPGVNLVVSGMGKVNAAAATAYLYAVTMNDSMYDPIWINAGIAGHKTYELGCTTIVRKITDQGTRSSYYPLPIPSSLLSSALVTSDVPEEEYSLDAAFDMEGSAFWSVATKFSPIEFVQLLKVVSDNPNHGIKTLDKEKIENYMEALAVQLQLLAAEMQKLASQHNWAHSLPEAYEKIAERFSFTVTQSRQLRRACQKFRAAELEQQLEEISTLKLQTAKQILAEMNARLERSAV